MEFPFPCHSDAGPAYRSSVSASRLESDAHVPDPGSLLWIVVPRGDDSTQLLVCWEAFPTECCFLNTVVKIHETFYEDFFFFFIKQQLAISCLIMVRNIA